MTHATPPTGRLRGFLLGLAVVFCAVLVLAACGGEPEKARELPERPPVVLISIDTLRSDRLPAYGYAGVETPHIDALRRDSVLFRHAWAPAPLTFPSHASVLTGLLPADHGVRDNLGFALAPGLPYLPRLLQEEGYATGAAVSAAALLGDLGLAEGFDFYEDRFEWTPGSGLGEAQRGGHETLDRAADWLRGVVERPFFLFFHLYEPHTPHAPPEPFASRYGATYDGEVAAADDVVGRLLRELRDLSVYDRALVVLLSDHGEGLGDHGEQEHGIFVYRESLQVPLMVKLPGAERAGETVSTPAQLIDVFPTILDVLEIPEPQAEGWSAGRTSLLKLGGSTRRILSETFYPRLHYGWSELLSVVEGRFHFISGPDPELYDLEADPGETVNVLEEERSTASALDRSCSDYDLRFQPPGAVDPELRQALSSLGYLGASAGEASGPLPDPKSRIHTLDALARGFEHFRARRFDEAAVALGRVIEENPRLVDAWEYLARCLHNSGKNEEALRAYLTVIGLTGSAPASAAPAATLLVEKGSPEEALRLLADQIERAPKSLRLRSLEIRILLGLDLFERALARAEEMVALAPGEPDVLYLRGVVRMMAGEPAGAEADLRQAAAADDVRALHDLAVLLLRQKRWSEAEGLLERVLELEPSHPLAPRHLEQARQGLQSKL